ncbi:MAG: serine/threonine-protein kinase, partial [Myxococcota bacterium]
MRKICLRCGSKFGSQAEFCPHDGTALVRDDDVPDSLIGTVLLEQFRIDALIGTGGMGTVYRARQTTIDRDVAVKVLRLELARDDAAVARFEREAQLAASLDHPNLVRVLLSGRLPDGRLYIVMELLEGRSLADDLDAQGIPTLDRALLLIMKLCAGLGAVHAKGIVHRDIKPENIYLVPRGEDPDFVKLVDFGISRALDTDTAGTESQSGRVFGTAGYISPEAATGEATDVRSDIYSVGVLAYQLFTGDLPFEGKTAGAVLMQHVHDSAPPMRSKGLGERVPPRLAEAVHQALRKDPADRFQTLAAFVDALAEAAVESGLLSDARPVLLGTVWGTELAAPGSFLAELLASSSLPVQADALLLVPRDDEVLDSAPRPFESSAGMASLDVPERSRTWLWASLGTLLVLLVGFAVWNQREEPTPTPVTSVDAPQEAPTRPDVRAGNPSVAPTTLVETA